MSTVKLHVAAVRTSYLVPCREGQEDASMIRRSGPPEAFALQSGGGVYIGNYNRVEGGQLYYDLYRLYLSFDLSRFAVVTDAALQAAAYVGAGEDDSPAANMMVGVYGNAWGPALSTDDWGSIDPEDLISDTVSGPVASGQTLRWNIDPGRLTPGQVNYLMLADSNESESATSEADDLHLTLYLAHCVLDPETLWGGILPHLLINGQKVEP